MWEWEHLTQEFTEINFNLKTEYKNASFNDFFCDFSSTTVKNYYKWLSSKKKKVKKYLEGVKIRHSLVNRSAMMSQRTLLE